MKAEDFLAIASLTFLVGLTGGFVHSAYQGSQVKPIRMAPPPIPGPFIPLEVKCPDTVPDCRIQFVDYPNVEVICSKNEKLWYGRRDPKEPDSFLCFTEDQNKPEFQLKEKPGYLQDPNYHSPRTVK